MIDSPNVCVIGVGMSAFGRHPEESFEDFGKEAIDAALADAGLDYSAIQMACCGHAMQGITAGQRLLNRVGATGIPIINVENACATGSTAFHQAVMAVRAGVVDVALAVGFEKMQRGPLAADPRLAAPSQAKRSAPMPEMFAEVFRAHSKKYGTTVEQMAMVSVKNHRNASRNPKAQYGIEVGVEDVLGSRMVADPLTLMMCCPTSSGAAAAIVARADFARTAPRKAATVVASVLQSERAASDPLAFVTEINTRTASLAYQQSGLKPDDLDVIELHDCFAIAEIVHYENLGLCERGEGGKFVEQGLSAINGRVSVSSSGGLLAKGHPLGATGVAQIVEIVEQLRGESGPRQVRDAKIGLAHCQGFGGAACIHILAA